MYIYVVHVVCFLYFHAQSLSLHPMLQGLLRRAAAFRLPMKKGGVKNLKEADYYIDVDWRPLAQSRTKKRKHEFRSFKGHVFKDTWRCRPCKLLSNATGMKVVGTVWWLSGLLPIIVAKRSATGRLYRNFLSSEFLVERCEKRLKMSMIMLTACLHKIDFIWCYYAT